MDALSREGARAAMVELKKMGFDWYCGRVTLWDADHITPLDEGGSWHPDNAQTLCQPCHKKKTAEQAARKATRRRILGRKHIQTERQRRLVELG